MFGSLYDQASLLVCLPLSASVSSCTPPNKRMCQKIRKEQKKFTKSNLRKSLYCAFSPSILSTTSTTEHVYYTNTPLHTPMDCIYVMLIYSIWTLKTLCTSSQFIKIFYFCQCITFSLPKNTTFTCWLRKVWIKPTFFFLITRQPFFT